MRETGINIKDIIVPFRLRKYVKSFCTHMETVREEQMRGQRAVTREDILQIPEVIGNPRYHFGFRPKAI